MTPVLTYTLTQQCGTSRQFCRPCSNSFTVQSCGPTHCTVEPPSQICLAPAIGGGCAGSTCVTPINLVIQQFVLSETYFDALFSGGFGAPVYPGTYEDLRDAWLQDYLLRPRESTEVIPSFACEWFANTSSWLGDESEVLTLCGSIPFRYRYYNTFVARMRSSSSTTIELRLYFNFVIEKVATTTTACYDEGRVIEASSGTDQAGITVFVTDPSNPPCAGDTITVTGWGPSVGSVPVLLVEATEP